MSDQLTKCYSLLIIEHYTGKPWGRGLTDEMEVSIQLSQDLSIPFIECRLRLAGYDYVMDIDMDMVLMPRANISLKPFFKVTMHNFFILIAFVIILIMHYRRNVSMTKVLSSSGCANLLLEMD